jgi:small subunit ribosomal protein S20
MPIIKSAKKKVRTSKRNRVQNLKYLKKMRKAIKSYQKASDPKKKERALSKAYSAIDKAQKINLIHKNKAARLKSRLVKPKKAKDLPKKSKRKAKKISKKKK